MNTSHIMLGGSTFEAAGFARSVVCNQLGYGLKLAAFQRQAADTEPQAEKRVSQATRDALGDNNGLGQFKALNLDDIVEGYAAAFILLSRFIKTPNPDNGRAMTHMERWAVDPDQLIQQSLAIKLERMPDRIRAEAEALGADPTKRIEATVAELTAQAEVVTKTTMAAFHAHLKAMGSWEDQALVDASLEALVDMGRNPAHEIKTAAGLRIDAARKAYNEGRYAAVDAGVMALAGVAPDAMAIAGKGKLVEFQPTAKMATGVEYSGLSIRARLARFIAG